MLFPARVLHSLTAAALSTRSPVLPPFLAPLRSSAPIMVEHEVPKTYPPPNPAKDGMKTYEVTTVFLCYDRTSIIVAAVSLGVCLVDHGVCAMSLSSCCSCSFEDVEGTDEVIAIIAVETISISYLQLRRILLNFVQLCLHKLVQHGHTHTWIVHTICHVNTHVFNEYGDDLCD